MIFGQKLTSAKNETRQKHISRGAEWRKFQLHSTFQRAGRRPQTMTSILVKIHVQSMEKLKNLALARTKINFGSKLMTIVIIVQPFCVIGSLGRRNNSIHSFSSPNLLYTNSAISSECSSTKAWLHPLEHKLMSPCGYLSAMSL